MSSANKQNTEKKTSKIENFFRLAHMSSQNRTSSSLSPSEQPQLPKKINMEKIAEDNMLKETGDDGGNIPTTPSTSLKQIIGQLIEEVKQLQESFHIDYAKLDSKLENSIVSQKSALDKLKNSIE